jgi:uncharacterized protein YigA (DUF484 family)
MNEQNLIDTNDLITDELISSYLQDNPDFFQRNPDLLTSLRLVDKNRGVVSLVERQQQQLRQKVHTLEEEITHLMTIAQHNESLFTLYSDLYLCLMDCQSLSEILNSLHTTTTELLSLADCKLWVDSPVALEHATIIRNDCHEVLNNRLADEPFYFGRLQLAEQQAIFESEGHSGSAVLIRLSHLDETFGFLAIISDDAEHFDPKMDTLLLGQFRKLVGKLIYRQLHSSSPK